MPVGENTYTRGTNIDIPRHAVRPLASRPGLLVPNTSSCHLECFETSKVDGAQGSPDSNTFYPRLSLLLKKIYVRTAVDASLYSIFDAQIFSWVPVFAIVVLSVSFTILALVPCAGDLALRYLNRSSTYPSLKWGDRGVAEHDRD